MTSTHIDVSAVDLAALGAWMDAQGLPEGEITGVAPVLGGTQNVMVRFERGGSAVHPAQAAPARPAEEQRRAAP